MQGPSMTAAARSRELGSWMSGDCCQPAMSSLLARALARLQSGATCQPACWICKTGWSSQQQQQQVRRCSGDACNRHKLPCHEDVRVVLAGPHGRGSKDSCCCLCQAGIGLCRAGVEEHARLPKACAHGQAHRPGLRHAFCFRLSAYTLGSEHHGAAEAMWKDLCNSTALLHIKKNR